ncbi:zinc-binding metallopeptidase family protein [Companilactobacillus paralimentarius]|uniref:hypothetical protein n=1 Tax=Companilactobacillus paralimentarius TaxID=83526 RepID=UPI001D057CF5|nr:hypothetical protein [Companilactobacillus paralimentarius]
MPITDGSLEQIDSLKGVFDHSFLPDYAAITVNGKKTEYHGKKAPSNAPDMAKNVLPELVEDNQDLTGQTGKLFQWLNRKIANQYNGKNLGLDYQDEDSGELQLSFYDLEKGIDELNFSISMRYPVTISEDMILRQLKSQFLKRMELRINRSFPSTVKDKDLSYMQKFSKFMRKTLD